VALEDEAMKRGLGFALVIAGTLALIAFLVHRDAHALAPTSAPRAAPEVEHEAELATPETELGSSRRDSRLTTQPLQYLPQLPLGTVETPQLPAPPKLVKFTLRVTFAGT
jgi:hypothetical protein